MIRPARVNPVLSHPDEARAALGDGWRFRLDPDDEGVADRWFADDDVIGERIEVPGTWQGQGFGHDGDDFVRDFRLQCRTFRATYKGTGWYALTCRPPGELEGRRLWLNFGGAHPTAEVWLNGVRLGENRLPFVPFGFEVTRHARFDADNTLVVRIHEANRELGFAYSWQGNWSGLYRHVEWRAGGRAALVGCRLHPDLDSEELRCHLAVDTEAGEGLRYRVSVRAGDTGQLLAQGDGDFVGGQASASIPVPSPRPWSPDAPALHRVDVRVLDGGDVSDAWSERVGFVSFRPAGKQLLINGEPYYMRGSGDFISCPETGCPDWDRDRWRRKLQALRNYGYNYVRLQSYVYGPEYYDAADEVGLLVQSEMGMLGGWGGHTQWHVYAWPPPTPAYREALRRQWNLIVERDVNHPSAAIYCMSNELGGGTHFPRTAWQCSNETKAIKPGVLVIFTDGGLNEDLPQDFVNDDAGVDPNTGRPVIQHEFRWWSSLPDVRLRDKYCGALRPYAAQLASDAAASHGIEHVLERAAENSQRLQLIEAKGKMESCRRDHPRLAGICHFNAMDANPSPQGIIDEFYQRKVADATTWLRANGDCVLLSSLGFAGRALEPGETLRCGLLVSDYSHPPMSEPRLTWRVRSDGSVLGEGAVDYSHEPFTTCAAGDIEMVVPPVPQPVTAQVEATLTEGDRCVTNQWPLWLLPSAGPLPEGIACHGAPQHTWLTSLPPLPHVRLDVAESTTVRVVLTERLDEAALAFARAGGRVILAASEGLTKPFAPKLGLVEGRYFFTPPANYPPYEDGHDGTIINDHPMLGDFPHEGFADLQFYKMMGEAPPLDLEPLGLADGDPAIRVMHSYPVSRPLGYVVERKHGHGGLIITALDLDQQWPEARYLLRQVIAYALSGDFGPELEATPETLHALVSGTSLP